MPGLIPSVMRIIGAVTFLATGELTIAGSEILGPSGAGVAQQDRSSSTASLEEIIVTAQKRDQNLQDVPISIRALGQKELERAGADSLQGYVGLAPSLNLVDEGPARTQINIRGVTTGDLEYDRAEVGESVGLYLDETPISTQIVSPNLGLLDIERIEVLRGPQGTLYGAGSLSGTIRMITHKPNLNDVEGSVDITGSYTEHGTANGGVSAVVNLPLANNVAAVRMAGFYRDDGGYIDNVTTGVKHINFDREAGGRVALRVEPSEPLTIDAGVAYQETHLGAEFSYRAEAGYLKEITALPQPSDSRFLVPSLVVGYDLGSATLTNAVSYYSKDMSFLEDSGGFASFFTANPGSIDGVTDSTYGQREFTEELRLSSANAKLISYTVGAFYQHKNNTFSQTVVLPGIDAAGGIDSSLYGTQPDQIFASQIRLKGDQYAIFGEATVNFTSQLAVTVGAREFKNTESSSVNFLGVLAVPLVGTQLFDFKANGFNPKVNVAYKINSDDLVYVQAAKGFRLGGTNEPIPADACASQLGALGFTTPPPSFRSDSLWNYEIGSKTGWLDGRLKVNGAVFYIDWKNPPLSANLTCGFSTEINAGAFKIYGAEFDMEARPWEHLTWRLGGSFNDGKLSGELPALGGHDGDRIPQSPRLTLSTSADYDFPVTMSGRTEKGFVHLDFRFVGTRITLFPDTTLYWGAFNLPSYQILSLRGGTTWGRMTAQAFVDNVLGERALLNETRFTDAFAKVPGTAIYTNRPRTVGLKLGWVF